MTRSQFFKSLLGAAAVAPLVGSSKPTSRAMTLDQLLRKVSGDVSLNAKDLRFVEHRQFNPEEICKAIRPAQQVRFIANDLTIDQMADLIRSVV